jgi:uncharacterized protein
VPEAPLALVGWCLNFTGLDIRFAAVACAATLRRSKSKSGEADPPLIVHATPGEGVVDPVAVFLSRGNTYGFPGVAVLRVETHCSEVYLVGNQAYKRKCPIAFSSVDYRTLSQRAAACRAELELNRRTAPELYLGNHTIRGSADGGLSLDGDGEVVDWLVAIRRFDQSDLFDRLAEAGLLTAATMGALADEVAGFHRQAEITPWSGGAAGFAPIHRPESS